MTFRGHGKKAKEKSSFYCDEDELCWKVVEREPHPLVYGDLSGLLFKVIFLDSFRTGETDFTIKMGQIDGASVELYIVR